MSSLLERSFHVTLLDPSFLALALLLPLALVWRGRGGRAALLFAPALLLRRLVAPPAKPPSQEEETLGPLPRTWRLRLLPLPRVLQVVGLLLGIVALARPAYREPLPIQREGVDILLCLDTSSSMTSNDMDRQRTRLAVAKDAAAEFVRGRPDDRIGLIAFARYADLLCPLTRDHDALEEILSGVETAESDGPEDATGIGNAVARAAQVLDASDAPSRVVILLTDGEENVALAGTPGEIAPVHAAQLSKELGVRVHTIAVGIGRPDATGALVGLDTSAVQAIAGRTGGVFYRARDAGAVGAVYARIDAMEKAPIEEPRTVFRDAFLAFLIAAVVLLLSSRLLESTVLGVLP